MTRPNDAAGEAPARLDDPRDDKHPPTQVRLRWIVSMMWELGMYTQAREVQRLGDAFFAGSETGPQSASGALRFDPAQAVCILKVRDALLAKDIDEAYHWLYTLDSKQVPHDPFKPWAELERLAAIDGGGHSKGQG